MAKKNNPCMTFLEYYTYSNKYTAGQVINSDCNSITFYNTGTNTMVIDGTRFAPGQQISFNGNFGEITSQKFNLAFENIGGVNNVTVYRKTYNSSL